MAKKSQKDAGASSDKGDQPLTLDEEFRYERAQRSTPHGMVSLAMSGDRDAIQRLASIGCALVDRLPKPEQLGPADWLADCLNLIARGVEPNVAFNWTQEGKRGRRRSWRAIVKAHGLAMEVLLERSRDPQISESKAVATVAARRHADSKTVREALYALSDELRPRRPFGWHRKGGENER